MRARCRRLSVHYRVHSRQMLCIGGSQIPFGWSFLSIAKVPMTWSEGDIWTAEASPSMMAACLFPSVIPRIGLVHHRQSFLGAAGTDFLRERVAAGGAACQHEGGVQICHYGGAGIRCRP